MNADASAMSATARIIIAITTSRIPNPSSPAGCEAGSLSGTAVRGYWSCCHVPGFSAKRHLVRATGRRRRRRRGLRPGELIGALNVSINAFAPLNVPVSAITEPLIEEPFAPLKFPLRKAMPS